jgi:hypothetical protein
MILVAILATGGYLLLNKKDDKTAKTSSDDTQQTEDYINYNPPTDEEKAAGDAAKANLDTQSSNQNGSPNGNATVIITDAAQYDDVIEVRSFISNHYEDGTCTITFTLGQKTVTKETPAYKDISTTICTNPLFQRSEFSVAGQWQMTVSYKSTGASGSSAPRVVTIK